MKVALDIINIIFGIENGIDMQNWWLHGAENRKC